MRAASRLGALLLLFAFVLTPALAQDNLDDELFGGDSIVTDVEETAAEEQANPAEALLASDTVTVGGSFSLSAEVVFDLSAADDEPIVRSGLVSLGSRLFLDARPSSDFRAFVKGDLDYSTVSGVAFDLRELFADIDLFDTVFLRAGKQTINWGVGFFFSPANLINIERVDPENPEEELAGPVALKGQLPIGNDNFTGYLLLEDIGSGEQVGAAARYEFLVENVEITAGGVYRVDGPWALMATASGNLDTGGVGDLGFFGEAVLQGNSDKLFVVPDPTSPLGVTAASSDALFVSGTVGGRFTYTTDDELLSLTAVAQYFFNGLGYDDPSILTNNRLAVAELLRTGRLRPSDLIGRGQHNAALSVSAANVADSDLTPSVSWIANLSDGSGFVTAGVRYRGIDFLTPSVTYRLTYGPEGGEYSLSGTTHQLSVGISLRGSF